MAEKVFLDACVLYPGLLRAMVLGAAEAGLIRPAWSPRVLEEWRLVAAREGPAAEDAARAEAAAMRRAMPDAEVVPDPSLEAQLRIPDPADLHVLAAAVAAGATVLLTFNLADFPIRPLARFGITPRHPDGFFWELLSREPGTMRPIIDRLVAASGTENGRRLLRKSGLPRLGKAWEAG